MFRLELLACCMVLFVSAVHLLIHLKFVLIHAWFLCHVVVAWQFILRASVPNVPIASLSSVVVETAVGCSSGDNE